MMAINLVGFGQNRVDLEGTEKFEIKSIHVNDTFEAWVALPLGYTQSSQQYKTLYVLDANVTFGMIRDMQTLISFEPGNPPLIIVGIAYAGLSEWIGKRSRDYMAKAMPNLPGSGGADKYLTFLENELIPEVEKRYRSSEERVIYGHSTAALLGLYSLIKKPDLFKGYILTSPSVDEDDQFTLSQMTKWEPNLNFKSRVYATVGSLEKESTQKAIGQLNQIMKSKATGNLSYESGQVQGTHMNSMAQAFINGLLFVNKRQ